MSWGSKLEKGETFSINNWASRSDVERYESNVEITESII